MKSYLSVAATVLLLTSSYGVVRYVNSYNASIQPSSFRSFSVSAEGKATSIPDVAKFSYSVITEGDKNIKDSSDKNTSKSNDILAFLKGSKVLDADIKTTSYSVEPRTQYYSCAPDVNGLAKRCPPSEIVGYTIRQSVEVKVRDFALIGDILNGVVVKGANSVSELQFTTDNPTKVEDEARVDAIEKAMAKAEGIALAGGFKVGRLLSVDEYNNSPMPYYSYASEKAMGIGGAVAPAPVIQPGTQDTKVNITLRYEIR
jgi:uncharacterized protein YggE